MVLPSLAVEIGLNEALILQQLNYWSRGKANGWVYNTIEEWHRQFPFLSERTIRRAFKSLEQQDLVETRQPDHFLRTKHYRVKYENLPAANLAASEAAKLDGSEAANLAASYREQETSREGERTAPVQETEATKDEERIYSAWPTPGRLTPLKLAAIRGAIARGNDPEQLCRALQNAKAKPFFADKSLPFILGKDEYIEELAELTTEVDEWDAPVVVA